MIDPVSGNRVPPGATPKEVRDDVPIMASENEYVLPADVVRYIGLDKIEKMVKQAKDGILEMQKEGRIGGEDSNKDLTPEFNEGGSVQGRTFEQNRDQIPFAFEPSPYLGGWTPGGNTQINQFVGPNGEILFIPLNNNGQLLFPPPEGFSPAGESAPTPETPTRAETSGGGGAMWSDGLTPEQIRQEQANRTFRTAAELNPRPTGGGGSFGDFIGNAVSAVGDIFSSLTSSEAFGGIVELVGSGVFGTAPAVVARAIDSWNDKREAEGLPRVSAEEVTAEAAKAANVPLTAEDLNTIAAEVQTSPSIFKSQSSVSGPKFQFTEGQLGNEPVAGGIPNRSNAFTADAATEEEKLADSGYVVLGQMGTAESPRYMVQKPDGSVSIISPGDEIGGATFKGIKDGIADPVNSALDTVANLEGSLMIPTSPMSARGQGTDVTGLGRTGVGFGASSSSSSSSPSPSRPSAGIGSTPVSFGRSSSGDGDGMATSSSRGYGGAPSGNSTAGVGRTGTGSGSVSGAFTSSRGSTSPSSTSSVGRSMGTTVSSSDPAPSAGYSMGTTVSSSSYDDRNPRGFAKGGLVKSPHKNYNFYKNYQNGGLVKK